jgi:hypothetical protein
LTKSRNGRFPKNCDSRLTLLLDLFDASSTAGVTIVAAIVADAGVGELMYVT